MSHKTDKPNTEYEVAQGKVVNIVWVALVLVFVTVILYFLYFYLSPSGTIARDRESWGVFGDFIGGVANPLIGAATLLIVASAYLVQRKELTNTVAALKESASAQERQVKLSALQGKISAHAAILSSYTESISRVHSELRRIANFDHNGIAYDFHGNRLKAGDKLEKEFGRLGGMLDTAVKNEDEAQANLDAVMKELDEELGKNGN